MMLNDVERETFNLIVMQISRNLFIRDWSLLIPGTGAEGNIVFSPKNL